MELPWIFSKHKCQKNKCHLTGVDICLSYQLATIFLSLTLFLPVILFSNVRSVSAKDPFWLDVCRQCFFFIFFLLHAMDVVVIHELFEVL